MKFKKNTKIRFSLSVLSQLLLKYANMLDVLIHQFVHMEFSDATLPIIQNFLKNICFYRSKLEWS